MYFRPGGVEVAWAEVLSEQRPGAPAQQCSDATCGKACLRGWDFVNGTHREAVWGQRNGKESVEEGGEKLCQGKGAADGVREITACLARQLML